MFCLNEFSLATVRALDSIRELISRETEKWADKGFVIRVQESLEGDLLVFRCDMSGVKSDQRAQVLQTIKAAVANGLSHIIIDEYEDMLVSRLVDSQYGYLSARDREAIKRRTFERLNGKTSLEGSEPEQFSGKSERKSRVWAKLAEYLEAENQLVLEGFITFRLKEYLEELFDAVDETVEDYIAKREYKEFLRLLKRIMDGQNSKVQVVNVVRKGPKYELLDGNLQPFDGSIGEFISTPPEKLGLDEDDIVVSAIVALSPERVYWHGATSDSHCYDLIADLLGERVQVCQGCTLHPQ